MGSWAPNLLTLSSYVTRELAEYLVKKGTRLVGIDTINIDNLSDLSRPLIRSC